MNPSIAHYQIVSKLGEGGMGAVYRALDTRLGREVAIKVLPEGVANDAGRMSRFEREAKVLAALNHSNIAVLYGVEDGALVMELVEGSTLAERMAQGPAPLDEALAIARQIADALEYAHERGIVHRDLKPANVKVTPEGRVKVLDFGLAKAMDTETAAGDPAASPTLTMRETAAGLILGTAGYMAPEQARGKAVDKRADIWAFGVVLYELLTGKHLYVGETVSDTLAAVLTKDPDLSAVPAEARRLIGRCLEKDPKKRLRDIGDYAALLDEAPAAAAAGGRSRVLPFIAAAVSTAAALLLAAWIWLRPAPVPEVTRFQIFAPRGSTLPLGTPAPSPDGRMIAYAVREPGGVARLHVRMLDSTESRVLPGTETVVHPFWSPDSRSLAVYSFGGLKRIDLTGGVARTLTETNSPWHGSWNQAGIILCVQPGPESVRTVTAISDQGGTASPVVKLDAGKQEIESHYPAFLSDGKRFLIMVNHADGARTFELAALGSTARRVVLRDVASAPVLAPAPNGKVYLLYLRDTSLMGQEFDETAGTLRGTPFLLVDQIGIVATPPLQPAVGVSPRGVLAYQNATEIGAGDARLTWFDRSEKALSPLPSAASGLAPRLSPDGRFAAVHRTTAAGNDIWVLDLSRGSAIRLTSAKGGKSYGSAVWSPEGKRVAYHLLGGGMYVKEPGGNGAEKELVKTATPAVPQSWSADGRQILFWHEDRLYLCQVDGGQAPITIGPASAVWATGARISPDGKFFAFASTGTGLQRGVWNWRRACATNATS